MELKTFISQALQDIVGGVDHAQKRIAYGQIIPKRENGNVDIEFELTISSEEKEGEKERLIVVVAAVGGGAKPPGGPPQPGAPPLPPPPPNMGKLKFKVPVRLPEERWYHFIYRWGNELRLCFVRSKKRPAKLTATEAAGGEAAPPPAQPSGGSQSAEQAQQSKKHKRSYWGFD